MHRTRRRPFYLALLAGCAFVGVAVWLSSGTMAPYASTLRRPLILKTCNYLVNIDHRHFEAPFLMLDGAPRERWQFGIYQRRILYPLLAYPLMKAAGFMAGGVITSAAVQVAAFAAFVVYVRRRVGEAAAYAAMALLATLPGIYYWAGLPYCHAMIVPASLAAIVILERLAESPTLARAAALSLGMGVLFLGYDLLPLFAPPVLAILLFRRRFAAAVVAAVMLVLPSALVQAVLAWRYGLPFRNKNTQAYFDVLGAYFNPGSLSEWTRLLADVPLDLVANYFYSGFFFLPALFLVLVVVNRFAWRVPVSPAERWILAATLLLFAFINLAPPTPGWVFRGDGIARIYQPVFVAMLMFAVRVFQRAWSHGTRWRPWLVGLFAATALANAAVVLGPALHLRLADHVYWAFYGQNAGAPEFSTNLALFGRRPLGFCDPSIPIQNPPPKVKGRPRATEARPGAPAATSPATRPATRPLAPATAAAPFLGG